MLRTNAEYKKTVKDNTGGQEPKGFRGSRRLCRWLTNAPNLCPPERLFSMFNATFGEDQKSSFGDYLELAMQSQYNKRNV